MDVTTIQRRSSPTVLPRYGYRGDMEVSDRSDVKYNIHTRNRFHFYRMDNIIRTGHS